MQSLDNIKWYASILPHLTLTVTMWSTSPFHRWYSEKDVSYFVKVSCIKGSHWGFKPDLSIPRLVFLTHLSSRASTYGRWSPGALETSSDIESQSGRCRKSDFFHFNWNSWVILLREGIISDYNLNLFVIQHLEKGMSYYSSNRNNAIKY